MKIIFINLIGSIIYLCIASNCWIEPELAYMSGANGGAAFVWIGTAFPILIIFGAMNAFWLYRECFKHFTKRKLYAGPIIFPVAAIWSIALCIDFTNH
jgi:hypothetical protein